MAGHSYLVSTMTSILIWAGISSIAFMVFFALILMSILQKRPDMATLAVAALFVGVGTGARAVMLSHAEVIPSSPVRNVAQEGLAFYGALLGVPTGTCVAVQHHRERLAPAFEKFECVHARVCAAEVRRIAQQAHGTWTTCASVRAPRPAEQKVAISDYAPEALGDTILVEGAETLQGDAQRWIYCAKDSSELMVVVKYR